MKNVIIYSTPTCHYCHAAKEFFKENNITYTEKNVAFDRAAGQEAIEKSGQMGVPVIDVGGKVVIGFDRGKINQYLGL